MTFNQRVFRYHFLPPALGIEEGVGIHEVYYDDAGAVKFFTLEPVAVVGCDVADLAVGIKHIMGAFGKPILDYHRVGSVEELFEGETCVWRLEHPATWAACFNVEDDDERDDTGD